MEGTTDTDLSERSALAMHLDYGHMNLESPARPVLDVTQDGTTDTDTDSGVTLGLWIFAFGIAGGSSGECCTGRSAHGGNN